MYDINFRDQKIKILLVSLNDAWYYSYDSLALPYLKVYSLKDPKIANNCNIQIINFDANEDINEILETIYLESPQIVGFSCYVWNIENILTLCRLLKQILSNLIIILGGPEVTPVAKKFLSENPDIDIIVRGEGERTFYELLVGLIFKQYKLNAINGITYRNNEGTIITNHPRSEIENLDEIPSPYKNKIIELINRDMVLLETCRGCPYKCNYCYYHKGFKAIRSFSLERVEEDLKIILDSEVPRLYIIDPTFNYSEKRCNEILKIISKYNKQIETHLELRNKLLTNETIDLLEKANVVHIEMGVQTTNPTALKNINRDFDEKKFKKNMILIQKGGMKADLHLIIGLPGDNYEKFEESFDKLFSWRPDLLGIHELCILPGTDFHINADKYGLKFNLRSPHLVLYNSTFSYDDLRKARLFVIADAIVDFTPISLRTIENLIKFLECRPSKFYYNLGKWWKNEKKPIERNKPDVMYDLFCQFIQVFCEKKKKENLITPMLELLKYEYIMSKSQKISKTRTWIPIQPQIINGDYFLDIQLCLSPNVKIIQFKYNIDKLLEPMTEIQSPLDEDIYIIFWEEEKRKIVHKTISSMDKSILVLCNGKRTSQEVINIFTEESHLPINESSLIAKNLLRKFYEKGLLVPNSRNR